HVNDINGLPCGRLIGAVFATCGWRAMLDCARLAGRHNTKLDFNKLFYLAEAKKPFDTNPEYLATPSGHPTPEPAIDLVKQLIDSESKQDSPQTKPGNEENSRSAMLDPLRAEFPLHTFVPARRSAVTRWVPDDDLEETPHPDYIEV